MSITIEMINQKTVINIPKKRSFFALELSFSLTSAQAISPPTRPKKSGKNHHAPEVFPAALGAVSDTGEGATADGAGGGGAAATCPGIRLTPQLLQNLLPAVLAVPQDEQ